MIKENINENVIETELPESDSQELEKAKAESLKVKKRPSRKTKAKTKSPKIELPDIKIPLANFLMNLSGKWKAEKSEAVFIEETFDWWCRQRAGFLLKAAPEIYLLLGIGNYLSKRLIPTPEEKELKAKKKKENENKK